MSIFYYIIKVALHMRSPAVNSVHVGKLYHILADMSGYDIIMYCKNAVNVLPKLSKYNPLRIKELK